MKRWPDLFVGLAILLSLAASLNGGVPWGEDRMILSHAADTRRTAILIAFAFAALSRCYREQSFFVGAARRFAAALERPRVRWSVLGVWTLASVAISVLQALALRVPLYDVGIFHQILWAISRGHGFVSTVSGAGDFLRDHASPSLALLAPLFRVTGSSPLFLPVIMPLLIATGAAAWVWLAERLGGARLAAAATVFAISFDSLWGNRYWGFHENAIAFACVSWAMALIFTGRVWVPALLLLISAGSKETLLLEVAGVLGVWAIATPATTGARALKFAGALGLLGAFLWFESIEHPEDKNYFRRYYAYLGLDTAGFVRGLLFSPARVIENVGAGEIVRYLKTVFLPFFPLLFNRSKNWLWLLAILPSFMSALLATYPPLRDPGFHYVLELWPILACVAIAALARAANPRLMWAWAGLALLACSADPLGDLRNYGRQAMDRAEARTRIAAIAPEASVAASELAGPWVAGRLVATRLPVLWKDQCPDWFVIQEQDQAAESALLRCQAKLAWQISGWRAYK